MSQDPGVAVRPRRSTAPSPESGSTSARRRPVTPARAGRLLGGPALWAVVLAAFLVFFALPLVWLLLAPTKTDHGLVTAQPLSFGSLSNIGSAWHHLIGYGNGALFVWLRNSLVYSFGAMALAVIVAVPAGYGLAVTQFIGRRTLLGITLTVMIMPATALVLPVFLEMNALHLIGTALSVILPFAFFPFGVYLAFIYFSTSIPRDLFAAARIDGCSEWQVFWHIAAPLAKPVVALVAFFNFVANWNNFFLPFVMLPDTSTYPLQIGLENLLSSTPSFNPGVGGTQVPIHRPELALATLVAIAPVLLVFLFSQRSLVRGLVAGATKE